VRICLVSPPGDSYARLADLLARNHEVTLFRHGAGQQAGAGGNPPRPYREIWVTPRTEMVGSVFAGAEHLYSAAVMEAIEDAYGREGPDFVEVADRGAHGLVPLMARRCANPLLERTRFAVRLLGTAELRGLHSGLHGDRDLGLLAELEREQLRLADRLLCAGGAGLDLYRRYYPQDLPEAFEVGLPCLPAEPAAPPAVDPGRGLRFLYRGELRRSDGALDLAEACLRLPVDDWQLTMVGADTETAPMGQSVRLTIEAMFDGDPRLSIFSPEEVEDPGWDGHDLAVAPATFAVWSEPALEAMRHGLPLLATPVGQLAALVEPGTTGWLTEATGAASIRARLLDLLEQRDEVDRVRAAGAAVRRYEELTDPERVLAAYERLLEREAAAQPQQRPRPAGRRADPGPLVSGVVPYHRNAPFVEEAVRSLLGQTHRNVEAVVVNDGSFEPADAVLERLGADPRVRVITQLNRGETVARNLGARMARGEYVVMLDADNALEPEFVARALAVFEREPELAYVSCWLRFVGPDGSLFHDPSGYAPLGNGVVREDVNNWDGDTLALLPRWLFTELELGFDEGAVIYSDWELYRSLRERGYFGTVIPEYLARYRFLGSSLQRAHAEGMRERGWNEARGRRLLRTVRWTAHGG
jgi:glycogen synthase